jgi:SAM-dependent methyltransferase
VSKSQAPAFGEDEIRPAHLMDGALAALNQDVDRLISRQDEFVRVACPACASTRSTPMFVKRGFHYEHCADCPTFFVNPRPTPAVLEWFYKDSTNYAYWNTHVFPAADNARRDRIVVPRVDALIALCERLGAPANALLEIGAGFGTFCREVLDRNTFRRVVALEPTPDLAQTCRSRGLETVEMSFEEFARRFPSERFSVIANFEVVEHLFSPADFFRYVHRALEPGGLMVLTCPSGVGFDIQTLGPVSESVDHEHLNYFSPASMTRLLAACGFEVVDVTTPGKLDAELVRKKILSGEFDVSTQPFLKRVLLDEWDRHGSDFQNFIADQGMSSSMWAVARKR